MSTRRLIAAALACGLVILLAGGIQLVLLSNRDTARVDALAVGESTEVDGRTVAVVAAARPADLIRLTVAVGGEVGDAAVKERFSVRAGTKALPLVEPSPCQREAAGIRCELSFDTSEVGSDEVFAVYRGARASWAL